MNQNGYGLLKMRRYIWAAICNYTYQLEKLQCPGHKQEGIEDAMSFIISLQLGPSVLRKNGAMVHGSIIYSASHIFWQYVCSGKPCAVSEAL